MPLEPMPLELMPPELVEQVESATSSAAFSAALEQLAVSSMDLPLKLGMHLLGFRALLVEPAVLWVD
jgi:hypothetical protein